MAVTYAFDFVLANFGIAMAAKMPMMTTTISSSMSVKPLRFICASEAEVGALGPSTPRKLTCLLRQLGCLVIRRDPVALRPAVTGGLPWNGELPTAAG